MRFAVVPAVIFFAQAAMAGVANVATPANFDAGVQYTVVVKDVNTLTIKSKALIVPAQQLSISNAPELILGLGPWPVCCPLSYPSFPFVSSSLSHLPGSHNGDEKVYERRETSLTKQTESHPRSGRYRRHGHQRRWRHRRRVL